MSDIHVDNLTKHQFLLINSAIPISIGMANYVVKRTGEVDFTVDMGELMISVSKEIAVLEKKPVITMELMLGKKVKAEHYRKVILVELLSGIGRLFKILETHMITLIKKRVKHISINNINTPQFNVDMAVCEQALKDFQTLVQLHYDNEDYTWNMKAIEEFMQRCMDASGKIDMVVELIHKYTEEN